MSAHTPDPSHWQAICDKFPHIFEPPLGLPTESDIKHKINLLVLNALIHNHFQHHLSKNALDEVFKKINDLLETGWSQSSTNQ